MRRIIMLLIAMLPALAWAAEPGPRETIVVAVERMVGKIQSQRERLEQEPELARELVREEIEGLVDFRRITRLVMAGYFEQASREQKYAFLEVFQDSLINTYASGITLYDGQEISVLPLAEGDIRGPRARVRTELAANDGRVIPVFFSLYHDGEGRWLVENVIVNGLNLGKTFRAQFEQSMQQYGDIDQVIANWSAELDVEEVTADPAAAAGQDGSGA